MDWKERNLKLAWDWWKEYGKPDDDLVNIPEALIAFGEFYNAEMTAERDQLRTELDAARKQIEQRDALLNAADAIQFQRHGTLIRLPDNQWGRRTGEYYNNVDCVGFLLDAYAALTSSGLDVPDGKEQDNDKNT